MKNLSKGPIVALLHIVIVLSLGGNLLYDRAHRPRLWVKTGSVDPNLPIRGRYLTLSLEVHAPEIAAAQKAGNQQYSWQNIELAIENGELVAHRTSRHSEMTIFNWSNRANQGQSDVYFLSPAVTFFIPEHAGSPRLKSGEELWAEVTIPKNGPPRPIQLAIKNGTEWTPLTYR